MFFNCPPAVGARCPSEATVRLVEAAIRRGDITWHAVRAQRHAAPLRRAARGRQ